MLVEKSLALDISAMVNVTHAMMMLVRIQCASGPARRFWSIPGLEATTYLHQ